MPLLHQLPLLLQPQILLLLLLRRLLLDACNEAEHRRARQLCALTGCRRRRQLRCCFGGRLSLRWPRGRRGGGARGVATRRHALGGADDGRRRRCAAAAIFLGKLQRSWTPVGARVRFLCSSLWRVSVPDSMKLLPQLGSSHM